VLRKYNTCQQAVFNAPEFDPIRPHTPENVFQATAEQLSDTSLATDNEIRAILLLHPRSRVCYDKLLGALSQSVPSLAVSFARYLTEMQDSLVDLLQRKQGWGAHLQRGKASSIARRAAEAANRTAAEDISQQQAALADALSDFERAEARFDSLHSP
jgi:hypothetical protein